MKTLCYFEGKIFSGDEPCLPVDDLGVQRAYSVFDYARGDAGRLFHVRDHLARLRRSAAALNLEIAHSDDEIIGTAMTLVRKAGLEDFGLRMIVTGGSAHTEELFKKPRFLIILEELPRYPTRVYERGVKLVTSEFKRDHPDVKTTNYLNAFRLEPYKRDRQAFEILYCWQGKLLECTRDNFFIIRGNTLVTAKDNVLHGITRKVVLGLARDGFLVEERDILAEELGEADGAFLTSTSKQIIPVVHVDDKAVGDGSVGFRMRTIMQRFREYVEAYQP